MGRFVAERVKFQLGFSKTMELACDLDAKGFTRGQVSEQFELSRTILSKGMRLYLTALGKTPDSGHIEIKNKAIDLVKQLDEDSISVNNADLELLAFTQQVTGRSPTYRKAATISNPDQQLSAYQRVIAQLEGMCYGLDKLPEMVHASITSEQRNEFARRLADCRRILERRINTLRKDENAEARNQEA